MFSQDVDISSLGITNLVIRQKGNILIKKYFKLDIINQDGLIFVQVSEYKENYGPFMIQNSLNNVSVLFKQMTPSKVPMDFPYDNLKPKSHSIFSWDYPLADKILSVDFVSDEYEKIKSPFILSHLMNVNETYQLILLPKKFKQKPLVIIVVIKLFKEMRIIEFLNGETRNIKNGIEILNENENEFEVLNNKRKEKNTSIKLILKMQNLGISLIQNTSRPFNELIFICFKGFEFIALDKNRIRTFQIRLKSFVINNNSSDLVRFPVVINSAEKITEFNEKFLLNLIFKKHIESKQVT